MSIYTVCFYHMSQSGSPDVHLIGYYDNIHDAVDRLKIIMPNYKKWTNNTVMENNMIGWINKNSFGPFVSNLSMTQPHSAVNLFEEL